MIIKQKHCDNKVILTKNIWTKVMNKIMILLELNYEKHGKRICKYGGMKQISISQKLMFTIHYYISSTNIINGK